MLGDAELCCAHLQQGCPHTPQPSPLAQDPRAHGTQSSCRPPLSPQTLPA